jgi:acyl-CoA thioesterase YciA
MSEAPTSSSNVPAAPEGELVIRTIAMPADTNSNGDIFGGWLLSQMDLGGAILARNLSHSRVATVAIDAMAFLCPVYVGDIVSCHASHRKTGRTSMRIEVEAWAQRQKGGEHVRVTHGTFTYVALDDLGQPHPVKRN